MAQAILVRDKGGYYEIIGDPEDWGTVQAAVDRVEFIEHLTGWGPYTDAYRAFDGLGTYTYFVALDHKADNLNPEQQKTVEQIGRIDSLLADLARALEQTKADLGCADWTTVAELAYIAGQLEQVRAFWRQDGPEYEPPTAYWSETLERLVTVPQD